MTVLLRDRLRLALDAMGERPDYSRLAADVLGIRNAPPELARRLVAQALVVEDRRDVWRESGERLSRQAPQSPGVYVLKDAAGQVVYVGKAVNLQRRLRAHFAPRRWRGLKAPLARVVQAEWEVVGSELEALLREAVLIGELRPVVNVQIGPPAIDVRDVPPVLVRDVVLVLPSVESDSAELIAARADGAWYEQRTRLNGADLAVHARRVFRFFRSPLRHRRDETRLAPIIFSWLARRGADTSRLDPHDAPTVAVLHARLARLLADPAVFTERLVVR